MTTAHDFIDHVPKDPEENVRWRLAWRTAAITDKRIQHAFYDAAMDDVLFFFNALLWLYEPRTLIKTIPFCSWPHQDPCILAVDGAITDAERDRIPIDVLIPKSRTQGATWICLMVLLRRWLRDSGFTAGLVTLTEAMVDSLRDPDTLIWKLVSAIEKLPPWMIRGGYERHLSDHVLLNLDTGATLCGYSATGDLARGGRRTAFLLDEMGAIDWIKAGKDHAALDSTRQVTNCRILPSTFGADRGAFWEATTEDTDPSTVKRILDWKDNPSQNQMAYKISSEAKVTALRAEEQADVENYVAKSKRRLDRLRRRGHTIENKVRSPWYDAECSRIDASPQSIAKELDMDPRGAVGKVFDTEVLDRMTRDCCQRPLWRGKFLVDPETHRLSGLIRTQNGPLKLWFRLGVDDNMVPEGHYGVGCDISAGGTGPASSNSVACGIDMATGQQVLEYAINGLEATIFARMVVALAYWLREAYLGWEATGPTGGSFRKEVIEELHYSNVYYRFIKHRGGVRIEKKPGWWNSSDADKGLLFEQLAVAMDEGGMVPRSSELIKECGQYEWSEDGKIVHAPTRISKGAGAEKAHGDRCIAGGVAWLLCKDRAQTALDKAGGSVNNPQYGCWAWREARDKADQKRFTDDDPQPTLADVLRI